MRIMIYTLQTDDILHIALVILNHLPNFSDNNSWRFVDVDYPLPPTIGNNVNFIYPECIKRPAADGNIAGANFYAIKIGDVDNSYYCDIANPESDNKAIEVAAITSQELSKNTVVEVPLVFTSSDNIIAWQMGLHFDPTYLQVESVIPSSDLRNMYEENFGLTEVNKGNIRVLWYAHDARPVNFQRGKNAFAVRFKVMQPIEDISKILRVDHEVLQSIAYEEDGQPHPIRLNFEDNLVSDANTVSVENKVVYAVPNPFKNELTLYLPELGRKDIEIAIHDVLGRQVAYYKNDAASMKNGKVTFSNTDNWTKGIHIWQVRTNDDIFTGKVIRE